MKYKPLSKNKTSHEGAFILALGLTVGCIRLCLKKSKYLINLGDFSAKGYLDAGTMISKINKSLHKIKQWCSHYINDLHQHRFFSP